MTWTSEVLRLFGHGRKSFIGRLADRFLEAVEEAAGSVERTAEAAGEARRRTRAQLRDAGERARSGARQLREAGQRARAGAQARRDALAERVESVGRRAAEIREERHQRREERRQRRARRRVRARTRRVSPMQLDVRRDDKIVLRGRRPVNLRTADGSTIRYRYYDRPGFWLRFYLHLTGRRVWPRR
ncbi:MAG: hypothetical protein JSV86_04550 [Gemmatimonadota bacterium]|nr:MAG: hypothetical protein JSV86_04550 [Gemmatimonadota bacterium]